MNKLITNKYTQCVQIYPKMIVPNIPTIVPAFLNAAGIARIPEPSDDFKRFANDLTSLKIKQNKLI